MSKKFMLIQIFYVPRSRSFRSTFSNEWTEKESEKTNLQSHDVLLKLLIAVDEIKEFLIKHQTEFLRQDPTAILETIYQYETFENFINIKAPLIE
ncbi:BTB/POZ protein [Rhizophagus irregularis DAOM 181602=DAOM 197198]|uniref:Uncharacterized protein n=1 Tax=Rhizophagus irregularis (strain DAOM 181602 / DAOM 197198 / MUCL 43194) TaxID=747089 RepID=U9STN5_RHIID|nr:hypothetical protein GLOIN_2v1764055 [Rhizophagus irregularis DAOM 181602=DAOM 197198]POG80808.1 hypothetical protein GLOIN_2v1764055 [Rhizophagus irregularis DAOM 181602=DAOM 197198]GBC32618.1 BTB/POZ protein [Rhizophagus irregularis DAOM 181602=DAOM 197198]|eukprot:XP_025187674.1 hypothetical protein GLOIN_2v1764055 [Rhizophagus irregularis DAOM 181602=DAOM 197198]